MLADRYRERLASLDHETLLSYAAELSFTHRHEADALLAKRSPLPAWARDNVLLSADLLPEPGRFRHAAPRHDGAPHC